MEPKRTLVLRFRAVNRPIFDAIRSGKKKVETRAATVKYRNFRPGDTLKFVCEKASFIKSIGKVRNFRTIAGLLKAYSPSQVNPTCKTARELREVYYSFPGYREKIEKFGIVALELE